MRVQRRDGFTLVEAAVVLVVLVVAMVAAYVGMREYQRSRYQASADADPHNVFEFRVSPESDSIRWDEDIVLFLEVRNPTVYDLEYKWQPSGFLLNLDQLWIAPGATPGTKAAEMAEAELKHVRLLDSADGFESRTLPSNGVLRYRIRFSVRQFIEPNGSSPEGALAGAVLISTSLRRHASVPITSVPFAPVDAAAPSAAVAE